MKNKAKTEKKMRETEVPTPDTIEELSEYIQSLVDRKHDYGTCVYAMSMASVATYNYVARQLGVTGFQASCADLDIIGRTRRMKHGFKITDYEHLLYPQYLNSEHFPTHQELLMKNREALAKEAKKRLKEKGDVHPDVKARWEYVASLG